MYLAEISQTHPQENKEAWGCNQEISLMWTLEVMHSNVICVTGKILFVIRRMKRFPALVKISTGQLRGTQKSIQGRAAHWFSFTHSLESYFSGGHRLPAVVLGLSKPGL